MSEPKVKKPSLFRTVVMKIVWAWRRVMDVKYNPLKYVPDPSLQAYFMLVLFIAWSLFFGVLAVNYLGFFELRHHCKHHRSCSGVDAFSLH